MENDTASYIDQYKANMEQCESPIERVMYAALNKAWFTSDTIHMLTPQQKIIHAGKEYRADFYVESRNIHTGGPIKLAVECDGHDFHDKTREQAARDKQRDRAFQSAGYFIMRFTGSEIFNDCEKCVSEIEAFLNTKRVKRM